MDSSPSDLGGFKEIIFQITGTDVFKRLKYESGVHRVQRVPATEAQGRIHTSTATVAVLPEAEEVDIEIKPDEIEINVCRASGKGGQGVNTTDSAVQIMHKPSGLIVRCADERSQQKNKAKAMTVLRSRLLERKVAEENAKYAAQRKDQVGTGERSEKIRTYNFPQNRVTDHRIEVTLYNLANFIDGDLDPLHRAADDARHGRKTGGVEIMSLPAHIKGLIFDCDGTLADTMPLHWRAWQMITQRHDLHFPEDRFYSLGGVPSRDILKMLAQEQGRSLDHIAVAHEKEEAYLPLMARSRADPCRRGNCEGESRQNPDGRRVRRHAENHQHGAGTLEDPASLRRRGDERNGEEPETRAGHFSRSRAADWRGAEILPRLRRHRTGHDAIRAAGMEAVDVRELRR